jgi:hypothetical protein
MSYTNDQEQEFRDEMDNYNDHGWTPCVQEFICGFDEELQPLAQEWYENTQQRSNSGPGIDELVRWGELPDHYLDDRD